MARTDLVRARRARLCSGVTTPALPAEAV